MKKKRYLGCLQSVPDPRDYTLRVMRADFPSKFTAKDAPIYNQGEIARCAMDAVRSASHTATGVEPGATFGYGYWRSHKQRGMYLSETCNGFARDGVPPRSVDSVDYEVPDAIYYAEKYRDVMLKAAKPYKMWQWARVSTVQEIKATIYDSRNKLGERCVISLPYVHIANGRWIVDGEPNGSHAMAIVGWDDEKGIFILRNSWGTQGGLFIPEGGYCWITYEDALKSRDIIALLRTDEPVKPDPNPDEPVKPKPDEPVKPKPEPDEPVKPEPDEPVKPKPDEPKEDIKVVRTLRLTDPYMRGDDVKHAQERLIVHGYNIVADGVFGNKTYNAVREFQAAKQLTIDGIVGKNTLAALDKDPAVTPPAPTIDNELKADFIAYLYRQIGNIYCWGGNGEDATDYAINVMETNFANRYIAKAFLAKQKKAGVQNIKMYDCSGLISRWLQDHGMAKSKRDCNHLWHMTSTITKADLQPCDLLFRGTDSDKNHVGVYVGNGMVIEAKGRDDGVVIRPIDAIDGYWKYFGRLRMN